MVWLLLDFNSPASAAVPWSWSVPGSRLQQKLSRGHVGLITLGYLAPRAPGGCSNSNSNSNRWTDTQHRPTGSILESKGSCQINLNGSEGFVWSVALLSRSTTSLFVNASIVARGPHFHVNEKNEAIQRKAMHQGSTVWLCCAGAVRSGQADWLGTGKRGTCRSSAGVQLSLIGRLRK